MPEKRKGRLSETLLVSAMLSVTGGILDAYTYLYRGEVFANGQTGNLVLFGIRAAEKNWRAASIYILPILAFLLGVLAAEFIKFHAKDDCIIKWRHIILALEIAILMAALVVPQGLCDKAVNVSVSFVCALQTQSFRSLKGKPYISVMCTGNLRSAAAEISLYGQGHDIKHLRNALEYLFIVMCFITGAFLGAVTTEKLDGNSLLLAILLLLLVFILLFMRKPVLLLCEKKGFKWLDW